MSDFAPRRESVEELLDFNVTISRADDGVSEQRRLKGSDALIGFRIITPAMTKAQMQVYRSFFLSVFGALTSFTFTNPFDDTEYTVRFVPGSFQTTFAGGVFVMRFELKRL